LKPNLSYTIWFSQRTGSTLLCRALEATGIAGKPGEHLYKQNLLQEYNAPSAAEFQQHVWEIASTENGALGIKHSFFEPNFSKVIEVLKGIPDCPSEENNRAAIWENAFPNHRHIFMTRRNKVRLAVSWWKAIQSQEWHRSKGETPKAIDLASAYSFAAIKHLYIECSIREAGIQEFFSEGSITPLTIVYEDFILRYEETIRNVLDYLGFDRTSVEVPPPFLAPTSDDISEEWVQRFRQEIQADWKNRGW
jgi:trehalose 2-sulfotransferase